MHIYRLEKTVHIAGHDYFGRTASITFMPIDAPGWYWKMPDGSAIEIEPSMLRHNSRRLTLVHDNTKMEIFEHVGALRFMGLSGVLIESSPWPPYFGRTHELWQALKPQCKETDEPIRWVTPRAHTFWSYPQTHRNLKCRFTEMWPNKTKRLKITIEIDYADLVKDEKVYDIPNKELLEQILQAHSQGWPSWLHGPSTLLEWFPFRPRHECITWPQEHPQKKTLRLFAEHRLLDLLGALSVLLPADTMLSGNIRSVCSGHEADYHVVEQIREKGGLVPIP